MIFEETNGRSIGPLLKQAGTRSGSLMVLLLFLLCRLKQNTLGAQTLDRRWKDFAAERSSMILLVQLNYTGYRVELTVEK